jgi:glutathione peroxidase
VVGLKSMSQSWNTKPWQTNPVAFCYKNLVNARVRTTTIDEPVSNNMTVINAPLTMLDGTPTSFEQFSNQVVLVVNVASRCGLSPQYEALEALQKKYGARGFTVLGVPSDQFKQELKTEGDIAEYCSTTWGVTFPMTSKVKVNGKDRSELYKSLVKTKDHAGFAGPVLWNFEKFLVLPNGEIHRFRPTTKPDDEAILALIEANLTK